MPCPVSHSWEVVELGSGLQYPSSSHYHGMLLVRKALTTRDSLWRERETPLFTRAISWEKDYRVVSNDYKKGRVLWTQLENLGGRGRSWVACWDLSRGEACKRKGGTLHPITQRYMRPMRVFPRDQRGCGRPPPTHPQASVLEVLSGFPRQNQDRMSPAGGEEALPTPQTLFRLPVTSVILNFLFPCCFVHLLFFSPFCIIL